MLPTFVGAGAATHSGSGATPAIHEDTVAGDFVLLFCQTSNGEPVTNPDSLVWTQIVAHGANFAMLTVFWRVAVENTPAPTVPDPGNHIVAFTATFRGVATAAPLDGDVATFSSVGNTGTWTCPSVTTTRIDCMIAGASSTPRDQTSAVFHGAPSNAALANLAQMNQQGTGTGSGGSLAAWKGEKATAGVTGSTTGSLGNNDNPCIGVTFALKPAGGKTQFGVVG